MEVDELVARALMADGQSASSMFMWKMSRQTPQSPPTSSASASAWSQRFRKYVSKRLSGSSARTPLGVGLALLQALDRPLPLLLGVDMGVTLPTVDGTTVRIEPPSA